MATVIKERETDSPIETETPKSELPLTLEPYVVFVFQNGTGGTIKEPATMESWTDSTLVGKIHRDIRKLLNRKTRIKRQFREAPEKRKHGGGFVSPKERKRRIKELRKEQEAIPDKIGHKRRLINEIGETLKEKIAWSSPLDPLQFRVTNVVYVEGEPLTPEDKEWWQFVRENAPEVWQLLQDGQEEKYQLVCGFFQRKQALRKARGITYGNEEEKRVELEKFMDMLTEIKEEDYKRVKPTIKKISAYFEVQTR